MIKVNKKTNQNGKYRERKKEMKKNKNLYKKFCHFKNLKLMCELAKIPSFVAIPKCKQFGLKIRKWNET